ncbi:Alcohol dehydrogenase superfamily, zinc-type [Nostoc flagelliforme CCNUN1]|uniref:Alcohol dehydrogenase superfamily, zinc-type n=1 Tax=Nostoc flagelliforme CCNUN1 TaxID=2038116 RepID=A0A2K8T1X6_9NOSO|nr:NADP-dependent oxidoreductase [Nostoc flagelliforme]AUB41696.1 Alcohol dehydrogenase superfamily, zinc-type [Nostoc flagelliforme CCNUN1]
MTRAINRQFLLAARPVGDIKESDFEYREEPIPSPKDDEVLVRTIYLSLDPTNRIWMSDMEQYMPPVEIGEVMRGVIIGVVEESKNPNFKQGDLVSGMLGWQDYAIALGNSGFSLTRLPNPLPCPLNTFTGPLGATGFTAYFGLLDIGQPKVGETVVVSAASGAVGSIVGQIAKIKGCRVVGITGSDEKCRWLTEELGFDAAINYKTGDLEKALAQACPNGIDVYFDNVGGIILDVVLTKINLHARLPLCGLISTYNASKPVPGPYNYSQILMKRALVQGFIILDYIPRFNEAITEIGQWLNQGKIKYALEIVEGLENAPKAILKLFDGNKKGKLIIKVSNEPT